MHDLERVRVRCQNCGAVVPDTAKVCGHCGEGLTLQCEQCGEFVPATAKVCGMCGHQTVDGRSAGSAQRTPLQPPAGSTPSPALVGTRRPRRGRLVAVIAVAVLSGTGALIAWLAVSGDETAPPTHGAEPVSSAPADDTEALDTVEPELLPAEEPEPEPVESTESQLADDNGSSNESETPGPEEPGSVGATEPVVLDDGVTITEFTAVPVGEPIDGDPASGIHFETEIGYHRVWGTMTAIIWIRDADGAYVATSDPNYRLEQGLGTFEEGRVEGPDGTWTPNLFIPYEAFTGCGDFTAGMVIYDGTMNALTRGETSFGFDC